MKTLLSTITLTAFVAVFFSASFALAVQAQTSMVMPTFYNQSGTPVNQSGTLQAGYYYTAPGSSHQIYYFGNGTFYDPLTGTYGGSVSNPNGLAGVMLNTGYVPGLPNTGFGGSALSVWLTLLASGLVAAAGVTYVTRRFVSA